MVKKSTLDRFIKFGGYDVMHKKGGTWRGFPEAEKKTGLTRMTIHRLLKEYPEPPSAYVRITQEDHERLKDSYSRLKGTEKILKQVQKYFRRSLIVDLTELRARQELLGESLEDFRLALKQQAEADEKPQSIMEKVLDNALQELDCTLAVLRRVIP